MIDMEDLMRYLFMLLLVVLFMLSCSSEKSNQIEVKNVVADEDENLVITEPLLRDRDKNNTRIEKLIQKGFTPIEEQSFDVELENWGQVKFISGYYLVNELPEVHFYLTDSIGNMVYDFPDSLFNEWIFYEVSAISFKDMNHDGRKDIIIIISYMFGHGEHAAEEFSVARVFFQEGTEFVNDSKLDEQLNDKKQNQTIKMVFDYVTSIR